MRAGPSAGGEVPLSVRVLPAVIAAMFTVVLAVLLFVPFVAREYRKRGELRVGTVLLRFAALLYLLGLAAYVLIPLPPVAPGFCEAFSGLIPQLEPFAGFEHVGRPHSWHELTDLLADGAVQQFGFNVLLFVPLGMFVRHVHGRGLPTALLAGFATSLLVELTQVTGIWFLYPCPYRLFDVDDLIANTSGALAGGVLAPLLRLVPGQHSGVEAALPRPVTTSRRLLGMSCDLLLLWWLGGTITRATGFVLRLAGITIPREHAAWVESATLWFAPAIVLLLITLVGRGSTLGQHAVMLRAVDAGGERAAPGRSVLAWLAGFGGFALTQGLGNALWPTAGALLALAWSTAALFGVMRTRQHRGIAGALAGLHVVDVRAPRTSPEQAQTPALHRSA